MSIPANTGDIFLCVSLCVCLVVTAGASTCVIVNAQVGHINIPSEGGRSDGNKGESLIQSSNVIIQMDFALREKLAKPTKYYLLFLCVV